MSAFRRWWGLIAVISLVGGAFTVDGLTSRVGPASAADVQAISVATGDSADPIQLFLPSSTDCPTATSKGGDVVDSYMVDDSKVPAADLGSLVFDSQGNPTYSSSSSTYTGLPLETTAEEPYSNQQTLPPSGSGSAGQVPADLNFTLAVFQQNDDFGSGDDLYAGTWDLGVACVQPGTLSGNANPDAGQIDSDDFWNVQVTLTAGATSTTSTSSGQTTTTLPDDFTWSLSPFTTSTSLTASPAGAAAVGSTVTLTATVSPPGVQGTVDFFNGSTSLGSDPVTTSSGVSSATATVGTLPSGADSITAQFVPAQYDNAALTGVDVFGGSTSAALSYSIGATTTTTTSPSSTTTAGATTTTTTVPGGSTARTTTTIGDCDTAGTTTTTVPTSTTTTGPTTTTAPTTTTVAPTTTTVAPTTTTTSTTSTTVAPTTTTTSTTTTTLAPTTTTSSTTTSSSTTSTSVASAETDQGRAVHLAATDSACSTSTSTPSSATTTPKSATTAPYDPGLSSTVSTPAASSGTGSSSSNGSLAFTGIEVNKEILMAALGLFIGLFLLSFSVPVSKRLRPIYAVPPDRDGDG